MKTTKATPAQLKKFISRLKLFLKQSEFTPAEFAECLGLDSRRIKNWVTDKSKPAVESINDFELRMKAFQEETTRASAALAKFFEAV